MTATTISAEPLSPNERGLLVSELIRQGFIGRKSPLEAFYRRFADGNRNAIYFVSGGGFGKTWLLKKIILDNLEVPGRQVAEIIDFFDTQNQSIHGVQSSIRERLNRPEAFAVYDDLLARADQLRGHQQSEHTLATGAALNPDTTLNKEDQELLSAIGNLEARANKIFIRCCQEAVEGREVVLLFDTFEKVQERYVGRWLLNEFLTKVTGAIVVLAGRPAPDFEDAEAGAAASLRFPDNLVIYHLPGLGIGEITNKILQRYPSTSPDQIDTIVSSTKGVPLLIDLILDLPQPARDQHIERLARHAERRGYYEQSEPDPGLFLRFADPAVPENRVLWAMAYFKRRFDVEMLEYLISHAARHFGSISTQDVLDRLSELPWVKEYPKLQSHLLHDEVQRLIAKYTLSAIQFEETYLIDLYPIIVEDYYTQLANRTPQLEYKRQLLAEQFGYMVEKDIGAGLERYRAYRLDIDQRSHDYDFEELLWGELRDHLYQLPANNSANNSPYRIYIDRGQWLQKHNLPAKAEDHYRRMLNRGIADDVIEVRQGLGFTLMRQGRLDEARSVFAASLQEATAARNYDAMSMICNNLGQEEQLAGRLDDAFVYFTLGFEYATYAASNGRKVSIYLNRGDLYSVQGKYTKAKEQLERAVGLLPKLGDAQEDQQRRIYAYLFLGTTLRHSGAYMAADSSYAVSLGLAQKNENSEAICEVLQHIGINHFLRARDYRRKLLAESLKQPEEWRTIEQRNRAFSRACTLIDRGWHNLKGALESAFQSEALGAEADGLNRLAKIYRELDRLEHFAHDHMPDLAPAPELAQLIPAAHHLSLPVEADFASRVLTAGGFEELDLYEKSVRLFDLSALLAEEAKRYHRALDSLTELARCLNELNYDDKVAIVVRRMQRLKGYDYQEPMFAAVIRIVNGYQEYKQGQFDRAFEDFADAFAALGKESGFATYMLVDTLRDLEWRLRDLEPELGLAWCDRLQDRWLQAGVAQQRPEMVDSLERVRIEIVDSTRKRAENVPGS